MLKIKIPESKFQVVGGLLGVSRRRGGVPAGFAGGVPLGRRARVGAPVGAGPLGRMARGAPVGTGPLGRRARVGVPVGWTGTDALADTI